MANELIVMLGWVVQSDAYNSDPAVTAGLAQFNLSYYAAAIEDPDDNEYVAIGLVLDRLHPASTVLLDEAKYRGTPGERISPESKLMDLVKQIPAAAKIKKLLTEKEPVLMSFLKE